MKTRLSTTRVILSTVFALQLMLLSGCSPKGQQVNIPDEIERCARLIASQSSNPAATTSLQTRLGTLYFLVGERQLALNWLTNSMRLQPTAQACSMLSDVYLLDGNVKSALQVIQQGLDAEPNDYRLHDRLGEIYLRKSEHCMEHEKAEVTEADWLKMAIDESRIAIRLNAGSVDAKVQLGTALLLRNQLDEARSVLQEALSLNKSRGDAQYVLGFVHLKKGERSKAKSVWKNLLNSGHPTYASLLDNPLRMANGEQPLMSGGGMFGAGETPTLIMSLGKDEKYSRNILLMYSKTYESDERFTGAKEVFDARFCRLLLPAEDLIQK